MKKIILSLVIALLATAAEAQVRVVVRRPVRHVVIARPVVAVRPAVVRSAIVRPTPVAVVRPVVRRRVVVLH
ncbi:hypothetical protein MUY27_03825 [Mucilaginibacter sp. RS28]|uniref:Uncharacterized protein n=1 Tax=Mucilaginibacter straminoryzae TaxID=2932774 RepID=A0A9X1X063_9SPHI|nr:hypothetical protein [Mucilaginibacter straminoryzae]MCJ8208822.1 hypothetical protein [Mucilaginibacter straminoryzae]